MDYAKLLRDPRWQKKRLKIMERDGFACRDTGEEDVELQVHHCWYAKGGPWETPDEFLLTLTKEAHKERQKLEARAKKALGLIMARTNPHDRSLQKLVESMELMAYDFCEQSLREPVECGFSDLQPLMMDYTQFSQWVKTVEWTKADSGGFTPLDYVPELIWLSYVREVDMLIQDDVEEES